MVRRCNWVVQANAIPSTTRKVISTREQRRRGSPRIVYHKNSCKMSREKFLSAAAKKDMTQVHRNDSISAPLSTSGITLPEGGFSDRKSCTLDFSIPSHSQNGALSTPVEGISRIPHISPKSGHFNFRECFSPNFGNSDPKRPYAQRNLQGKNVLSCAPVSNTFSECGSKPANSDFKPICDRTPLPRSRQGVVNNGGSTVTNARDAQGSRLMKKEFELDSIEKIGTATSLAGSTPSKTSIEPVDSPSTAGTSIREIVHDRNCSSDSWLPTASGSTEASLRLGSKDAANLKPHSILMTLSTKENRRRLSAPPVSTVVRIIPSQPGLCNKLLRGVVVMCAISLLSFCGLVFLLQEFSSGRCWTEQLTNVFQKNIMCSEDSIFRFVPFALQSYINMRVLQPEVHVATLISSDSLFDAPVAILKYHFCQLVVHAKSLFHYVSFPQLGRIVDPDGDNRTEASPIRSAESAFDVLTKTKQRIINFELSGIVEDALENSTASRALREHNREFKKKIEHVVDNVFVAIGYGLANVVIVDTPQGLILFDTLENPVNMHRAMQDWMELKKRQKPMNQPATAVAKTRERPPVIAIIYSHFHTDHVFGASAVYDENLTQIWAHEATDLEIRRVFTMTAGATYKRSMKQFGALLSEKEGFVNAGIGLRLDYDATAMATAIRPTHTWKGDRITIEIGGEVLELIQAPGESKDQSIVWLPKKELLFGADNIYKSLPNIYAIRGTESRDAMLWVKSLDIMRELKPRILVLGHTSVLRGRDFIESTLTAYRDAIQYIHDQTVRHMNKGHPVNDIVEIIKLPPHLHNHPYLQPYYGTVPWAVRAIFYHYVGWFSGLSEELHMLSRSEKARKMAELVGGRIYLLERSMEALEKEEYQWALELVSHAQLLSPYCETARRIKKNVLRILAATQSSAPGRNWYLTAAREVAEYEDPHHPEAESSYSGGNNNTNQMKNFYGKILSCKKLLGERLGRVFRPHSGNEPTSNIVSSDVRRPKISDQLRVTKSQKNQCIKNLKSAVEVFSFIPIRMKAEAAFNVEATISFTFTDIEQFACIHFRRGIAYVAPKCERQPDINVFTTDKAWRSIVTYELQPLAAVATGKLRIDSKDPLDYLRLKKLLSLVEIDME